MPSREFLSPREPVPEGSRAKVAAPIPGRYVLFGLLGLGLTMVFGVALFALLTRPPRASRLSPTPVSTASPRWE